MQQGLDFRFGAAAKYPTSEILIPKVSISLQLKIKGQHSGEKCRMFPAWRFSSLQDRGLTSDVEICLYSGLVHKHFEFFKKIRFDLWCEPSTMLALVSSQARVTSPTEHIQSSFAHGPRNAHSPHWQNCIGIDQKNCVVSGLCVS